MTRALVPLRATGSERVHLVAFSPGGMGAGAYRDWAPLLSGETALWGVRLPGRENRLRESCPARMGELIAPVLEEIGELPGPAALFGHSFGALAAYAAAVELGERVVWLGLSGMGPGGGAELPGPDASDERLLDRIRGWGAAPADAEAHPELLRMTLAALRADLTVARGFLPVSGPEVACPVALFGGAGDSGAGRADLLGWRAFAAAEVGLRIYPGGHFHFAGRPRALVSDIDASIRGLRL
ncbi:alpha/beta fold hydrolase [Streptomyces sp. NPDC051940]|uniref:thioesterase II family protein n=1 Tax=Streptomyces sp. NPDC051940 TaxID=3155675 RepID=UPI00343995B5